MTTFEKDNDPMMQTDPQLDLGFTPPDPLERPSAPSIPTLETEPLYSNTTGEKVTSQADVPTEGTSEEQTAQAAVPKASAYTGSPNPYATSYQPPTYTGHGNDAKGNANYQPPQYREQQASPYQNSYGQSYQQPHYSQYHQTPPPGYQQKSRLAAALLGVLFGGLGVHNFYLGNTTRAVIQLVVCIIGGTFTAGIAAVAMWIWGFVEGVHLLIGKEGRMYDANNVILRD